ncbi:MAG: prepilin-type N-terminal cleavage/methylation domain-containing protein [bacterium]
MTNKPHNNTRRSAKFKGFTIVETLVAVMILSIAMAGSLALASKGLNTIVVARQEVNATYLAQDVMEYLRALRDTNCITASSLTGTCANSAWLGNLPTLCAGGGCFIDTVTDAQTACGATCPVMNYDETNHVYTYNAVTTTITPTVFTRTVYIQNPVGGNASEASTTVLVSWPSVGGVIRSVRVHDNLYNWE